MSEQNTTLDEYVATQNSPLSDNPNGIRLALDEVYPEDWGFAELDSVCEINSGFSWNKDQELYGMHTRQWWTVSPTPSTLIPLHPESLEPTQKFRWEL